MSVCVVVHRVPRCRYVFASREPQVPIQPCILCSTVSTRSLIRQCDLWSTRWRCNARRLCLASPPPRSSACCLGLCLCLELFLALVVVGPSPAALGIEVHRVLRPPRGALQRHLRLKRVQQRLPVASTRRENPTHAETVSHYTSVRTVEKAVPQSIDRRGHAIWIHASTSSNSSSCNGTRTEVALLSWHPQRGTATRNAPCLGKSPTAAARSSPCLRLASVPRGVAE